MEARQGARKWPHFQKLLAVSVLVCPPRPLKILTHSLRNDPSSSGALASARRTPAKLLSPVKVNRTIPGNKMTLQKISLHWGSAKGPNKSPRLKPAKSVHPTQVYLSGLF